MKKNPKIFNIISLFITDTNILYGQLDLIKEGVHTFKLDLNECSIGGGDY